MEENATPSYGRDKSPQADCCCGERYLSLFLAILFLPTRPQCLNHSSPKAKSGAWASSPATPCCHPANNRLGVPHPLPPASGWLGGQRGAALSQGWEPGLLLARSVPAVLQWKEFLWFSSNSKPQGCTFRLCGRNAQCKTGFSSVNGLYLLLLLRLQAHVLCSQWRDHDTTGTERTEEGTGGFAE